jgi:two-component SAPR family response regulator
MASEFIGRNEWLTVSPAAGIATIAGALALAETAGVHVLNRQLLFDCALASLNNGDQATAERYLQEVRPMVEKLARCDLASYHYVSALCALLKGNLSVASGHQEKGLKLAIETGMPLFEAIFHLLSAQVLHECNKDNAAQVHVVKSLQQARKGRARFVEYMGLLTEAQIALDLGKERKGLEALSKGMTLGREHGYINTFTWRADVMARLCAKALEAGIEVEYVQQLIRKRGLVVEKPSVEVEQWPWAFKIYTLGRFNLLKNDEPVRFSRKAQRKPIDLLKALIAFGGRSVSENQTIEALWPEAEGDVAHQSLSTTLHRLRRLLGRDETIRRQEGKLSLDDRLCWVDIWAIEHLLACAETVNLQTQNGDVWSEVEKSVERAAALYHGPFLGEEEYSWAIGVTERVERRLLRALRQVGRNHEQDSAWEKAIDCYDRALQIAPCTEELYRRLITVNVQLGRRVEALAAYERCRRILSTKMGLAPSHETEALYRSIRSS